MLYMDVCSCKGVYGVIHGCIVMYIGGYMVRYRGAWFYTWVYG